MEILALFCELADQLAQLLESAFGRADRQTFFAVRIRAGLARVQPVLDSAREKTVRDVPNVGFLVRVGDSVAQIDGLAESFAERIIGLLHGRHCPTIVGAYCSCPGRPHEVVDGYRLIIIKCTGLLS